VKAPLEAVKARERLADVQEHLEPRLHTREQVEQNSSEVIDETHRRDSSEEQVEQNSSEVIDETH
jgi:hypothetical protein